jgi:hypothetical protein
MNPSYDPLYLHQPLEHRVEFPVLGIPVRFATNDRAILDQVEEVFGHWRGGEPGSAVPSAGADIRLFLHDGDEGSADEPTLTFRAPDPLRWMVHTPGSFGLADLERRVGVAYVTRALVEDRPRFRVSILQFLVFIIITIEDRTPIHAAMIGRGDAALLLAGPAGSGKSTLAYAASKAGFDVLSDDAAYIQLEPRRVWGGGASVLLLGDAAARWPEFAGMETALFPTGKRKTIVRAGSVGSRPWVTRAGVCLLDRAGGPVKVTRIGAEEIRPVIVHDPAGAGGRFGARLEQSADWLSAHGGWRMSLSSDPGDAIPHLQKMLREIEP